MTKLVSGDLIQGCVSGRRTKWSPMSYFERKKKTLNGYKAFELSFRNHFLAGWQRWPLLLSALGWTGGRERKGRAWVYPQSNNCTFWLPLKTPSFQFLTHPIVLPAAALTTPSSVSSPTPPVSRACAWCLAEAEEHRGSAGLLDGQRLRTAQLRQAGPRPEPRHARRPGHPRPPGSDGLQVSLWRRVFPLVFSNEIK